MRFSMRDIRQDAAADISEADLSMVGRMRPNDFQ
jgi:hypothetical protein